MKTITFYSRTKCSLCEKAKTILELLQEELPFQLNEIDIETDDELYEKYGLKIPVVTIDGAEVQYGRIDATTLRKRLQQ